jgi:hypothetical protein
VSLCCNRLANKLKPKAVSKGRFSVIASKAKLGVANPKHLLSMDYFEITVFAMMILPLLKQPFFYKRKMEKIKIVFTVLFTVIIIACGESDIGEPAIKRSILVYMAGDNGLSSYCENNIKAIHESIKNISEYGCVYIYYDKADTNPKLIKLYKNKNTVDCDTIVKYEETNSASAAQLSKVITDAFANDNYDSYGLVLWSHATGWLPPDFLNTGIRPQSFGRDNGYEMDIKDLSTALPDNFFEYIIFDACNMGTVEVAYQLRNKTQFILSATSEISAEWLPYQSIIPLLLSKNRNFREIVQISYDYYITTLETSVAISLIETSEIENLAATLKNIYSSRENATVDINNIQHFDRYFSSFFVFYDLEDFIKNIATQEELMTFQNRLYKVVLFARSSPVVYRVKINTYCGLSTYIYGISKTLDTYYQTLDWYKSVY